jgi:hypothetical protein
MNHGEMTAVQGSEPIPVATTMPQVPPNTPDVCEFCELARRETAKVTTVTVADLVMAGLWDVDYGKLRELEQKRH